MPDLAETLDTAAADSLSLRHRPARAASFPEPAEPMDYVAREATYLLALLADPLRELGHVGGDASRAIAEAALVGVGDPGAPFDDLARLEDALEQIARATDDGSARSIAEDALALYRGR